MVLYLAAVINPVGLEIASAISAWAAAMALTSLRPEEVSRSTVGALGVSLAVLILSRALAPLWTVFIAAAFFGIGATTPLRSLARRRDVRAWLVVCTGAGVASVVWDLVAHPFLTEPGTPIARSSSGTDIAVHAVERLTLLVTSSIGRFGWLDAPSPYGVIVAWLAALGAVFIVGTCLARRRGALVATGTLVAWLVLPTVLIISQARQSGILGQGRDFMGLAVGIPIVAGVVAGERTGGRELALRISTVVIAVLAVCQLADFYGALRRYTVGDGGPLNAFASVQGGWHPPVPGEVLVAAFALAIIAFAVILRRAVMAQPPT
jgi:hypothetical protein